MASLKKRQKFANSALNFFSDFFPFFLWGLSVGA